MRLNKRYKRYIDKLKADYSPMFLSKDELEIFSTKFLHKYINMINIVHYEDFSYMAFPSREDIDEWYNMLEQNIITDMWMVFIDDDSYKLREIHKVKGDD